MLVEFVRRCLKRDKEDGKPWCVYPEDPADPSKVDTSVRKGWPKHFTTKAEADDWVARSHAFKESIMSCSCSRTSYTRAMLRSLYRSIGAEPPSSLVEAVTPEVPLDRALNDWARAAQKHKAKPRFPISREFTADTPSRSGPLLAPTVTADEAYVATAAVIKERPFLFPDHGVGLVSEARKDALIIGRVIATDESITVDYFEVPITDGKTGLPRRLGSWVSPWGDDGRPLGFEFAPPPR